MMFDHKIVPPPACLYWNDLKKLGEIGGGGTSITLELFGMCFSGITFPMPV